MSALLRQAKRARSQNQGLTGDDATFHVGQMLNVDYDVPREVVKFFASAIAGEDLDYVDFVLV